MYVLNLLECVAPVLFMIIVPSWAHDKYERLCTINCACIINNKGDIVEDPAFIPWQTVSYRGRIFVTSPRINPAQTATLTELSVARGYKSVTNQTCQFKPYPCWEQNNGFKCEGLFSVTSGKIDCCHRFWVLDGGIVGVDTPVCPPKVVLIDLNTDKILEEIYVPSSTFIKGYHMESIEVEVDRFDCNNTHIYIADQNRFAVYVLDYSCHKRKGKDCWKTIVAKEFLPDKIYGVFTDGVNSLVFMVGVHTLALGPATKGSRCKWVYFHPLSSDTEFRMTNCFLKESGVSTGLNEALDQVETLGCRGTQSSGEAVTADGVMFQSLIESQSIACWNTRKRYKKPYIKKVFSDKLLTAPVHVAIEGDGSCWKKNSNKDNLFVLSSNFVRFISNKAEFKCDQHNSVLLVANIGDLLKSCRFCSP